MTAPDTSRDERALHRDLIDGIPDLVKRATAWSHTNDKSAAGFYVRDFMDALAAQSAAITSLSEQVEMLRKERDEARTLVTEANNSLYGSRSYFHSISGPFNPHHLSEAIEALKTMYGNACTRAEAAERRLAEAKKGLTFIRDGYADPNIKHVDFRVGAYQAALHALGETAPELEFFADCLRAHSNEARREDSDV